MPKNWKYLKKLLEKEFLCEKLRGYITYDLTDYRPAPWYQQHFIMKFDKQILVEAFQPECSWDKRCSDISYSLQRKNIIYEKIYQKYNLSESNIPIHEFASIIGDVLEEGILVSSHHAGIYGVHDIIDCISTYLHSGIDTILRYDQDPFIQALGILDRRCGKRRLKEYASWEYVNLPTWQKAIYRIRFEAENIAYSKIYNI